MLNSNTTGEKIRTALLCAATLVIAVMATASAHPLGNFTINHFARIEPNTDRVNLHYVIDMAEIPAFQEMQKISPGASPSNDELAAYAGQLALQLAANLTVIMNDRLLPLTVLE